VLVVVCVGVFFLGGGGGRGVSGWLFVVLVCFLGWGEGGG
jgi:hypothetical protein